MARQLKVAVIGAGAAGLVTARELEREGHQVVVYEKSGQIGGTWLYTSSVESDPLGIDPTREIVHSSLYSSLRTNSPRHLMGFSDYPYTIRADGELGLGDFPGHQEVLEFLNQFARDFGLIGLIRFDTEVLRVEKENHLWVVESRLIDGLRSEELFEAVVVCNGHNTKSQLADIPGVEVWPGKQIHSHNYRVPDEYRDKVVVVIGAGPSAHDISQDIATVAKEVHLSSRSPEIHVSKIDMFANVWQHSQIDCCYENGEVAFKDGASVAADIILHCTGYQYEFPFLKPNGILTIENNRIGHLYKHVFPPEYAPQLSFVGIPTRALGFFSFEIQAKWIACVLSGKTMLLPKQDMISDIQQHYRRLEEDGIPKNHTHRLPFMVNSFEYLDWVAAQTGSQVDEHIKVIYSKLLKAVKGLSWFGSIKDIDFESLLNDH